MNTNIFSGDFSNYIHLITKSLLIFAAFIYLIFALITVKQVSVMSKNIVDKFNPIVIIFSYFHLFFVIFLIISLFAM